MATKITSSLPIVCCFLFIMIPYIITPQGLEARKLVDLPQNTSTPGNKPNQGPSKSGVDGSHSRRAGSATGDSSPSGKVRMPPPTAVTKVSYGSGGGSNGNGNQVVNGGSNYHYSPPQYYYSPPTYYRGNNNGFYGGNSYYSPPSYQGYP